MQLAVRNFIWIPWRSLTCALYGIRYGLIHWETTHGLLRFEIKATVAPTGKEAPVLPFELSCKDSGQETVSPKETAPELTAPELQILLRP